eukprot:3229532-Rhodomonas_salina.3
MRSKAACMRCCCWLPAALTAGNAPQVYEGKALMDANHDEEGEVLWRPHEAMAAMHQLHLLGLVVSVVRSRCFVVFLCLVLADFLLFCLAPSVCCIAMLVMLSAAPVRLALSSALLAFSRTPPCVRAWACFKLCG